MKRYSVLSKNDTTHSHNVCFQRQNLLFSLVDKHHSKNTLKMDLEEILTKVGLDEKEAKIYVALLDLGSEKVHEIAKKAGVKRLPPTSCSNSCTLRISS